MSFPIFQLVFILFTSLSFPTQNVVIARNLNHSKSLDQICNKSNVKSVIDQATCLKILQSQKGIASSTNQTGLAIVVIESGVLNATNTKTYIEKKLKDINLEPNLKGVLQECKSSYNLAIGSFLSALGEVKMEEYQTATYDLMIASTDNIDQCGKAVAKKKIKDEIIVIGNKVLPMFGFIGYNVVNDLYVKELPLPKGN